MSKSRSDDATDLLVTELLVHRDRRLLARRRVEVHHACADFARALLEVGDDHLAEAAPLILGIDAHPLHLDARVVEGTERAHRDDDAVELADEEVAAIPEVGGRQRLR